MYQTVHYDEALRSLPSSVEAHAKTVDDGQTLHWKKVKCEQNMQEGNSSRKIKSMISRFHLISKNQGADKKRTYWWLLHGVRLWPIERVLWLAMSKIKEGHYVLVMTTGWLGIMQIWKNTKAHSRTKAFFFQFHRWWLVEKPQFFTISFAKLLSDSSISQSHSNL